MVFAVSEEQELAVSGEQELAVSGGEVYYPAQCTVLYYPGLHHPPTHPGYTMLHHPTLHVPVHASWVSRRGMGESWAQKLPTAWVRLPAG